MYQQRYFKPVNHESFDPNIYSQNRKIYTRNQLLVSGYLDDELIHAECNLDRCKEIQENIFNFNLHREPDNYKLISAPKK